MQRNYDQEVRILALEEEEGEEESYWEEILPASADWGEGAGEGEREETEQELRQSDWQN